MHIYIFGSVCRGEVSMGSDIDMLALVKESDVRFDPSLFSIYTYRRIEELWARGNPFAWHLALESRLVYASDSTDFIGLLGHPSAYPDCVVDCEKFRDLFTDARMSLTQDRRAEVFDLSTIFLSIRNIATCYSLGVCNRPDFSRHSAIRLSAGDRVPLSTEAYSIIERARILTTRGQGESILHTEADQVLDELDRVASWMDRLVRRAREHGTPRVQ